MIKQGRIIKGIGGFYYVSTTDTLYECKAKGNLKLSTKLLVGDLVDFDSEKNKILKIHKRKNQIIRPAISNIDQIVVFMSLTFPKIDFLVLDKILINNQSNNIPSLIVLNKVDEADEAVINYIKSVYKDSKYKLFFISSKRSDIEDDFDILLKELKYKFSVLSGNSGVGKSTFINRLLNNNYMEIGDISVKIKRGKHTTRHSEIFMLDDSTMIADTPGYGRLDLLNIVSNELKVYYKEFYLYNNCNYSGCSHTHEPKCGVIDAVNRNLISNIRYENYMKIYKELKYNEKY